MPLPAVVAVAVAATVAVTSFQQHFPIVVIVVVVSTGVRLHVRCNFVCVMRSSLLHVTFPPPS